MNPESLSQIIQRDDAQQIIDAAGRHILAQTEARSVALVFDGIDECIETRIGTLTAIESYVDTWQEEIRISDAEYAEPDVQTTAACTVVTLPMPAHDGPCGGYAGLFFDPGHTPATQHITPVLDIVGRFASLHTKVQAEQHRYERLELLYDVGRELASTLDLDDLLYDTIRLVADVTNADAGSVMILDPETDELVFQITHGEKRDELAHVRLSTTQGIAGWVFQHGKPAIVNDPLNDPRFADQIDQQTGYTTRNILCTPLQVQDHTIGVLQVLNKRNNDGFDKDDLELLLPLAGEAAIALENARLYRALREERDRIIEAQEEVRRGLARNLHDGTTQMLSSIQMSLSHARRLLARTPDDVEALDTELAYMEDLAQRAIRETRTLLFELRPVVLETRGLPAALDTYVQRLNETRTGPEVALTVADDIPELPQKISRTLFALIQEAVTNARKHADARRIIVVLGQCNEHIKVTVQDDGRGFKVADIHDKYDESGSLGLLNMRERVEYINATLDIRSAPDKGTTVCIQFRLDTLPVDDEQE